MVVVPLTKTCKYSVRMDGKFSVDSVKIENERDGMLIAE